MAWPRVGQCGFICGGNDVISAAGEQTGPPGQQFQVTNRGARFHVSRVWLAWLCRLRTVQTAGNIGKLVFGCFWTFSVELAWCIWATRRNLQLAGHVQCQRQPGWAFRVSGPAAQNFPRPRWNDKRRIDGWHVSDSRGTYDGPVQGHVVFEEVSFAYPTRPEQKLCHHFRSCRVVVRCHRFVAGLLAFVPLTASVSFSDSKMQLDFQQVSMFHNPQAQEVGSRCRDPQTEERGPQTSFQGCPNRWPTHTLL